MGDERVLASKQLDELERLYAGIADETVHLQWSNAMIELFPHLLAMARRVVTLEAALKMAGAGGRVRR